MSVTPSSNNPAASFSIEESKEKLQKEFDFLPAILDLLSSIQNSKEQKDEIIKKVNYFQTKMANAKEVLNKIGGLDTTVEEQDDLLLKLTEEIKVKRESLLKFEQDLALNK